MVHFSRDSERRREQARHASGQFGNQHRSSPEVELNSPDPEPGLIPAEVALAIEGMTTVRQEATNAAVAYVDTAMAQEAEEAYFDISEEGAYLVVADVYDDIGDEVQLSEPLASDVNFALSVMGEPDVDFDGELMAHPGGGYGWLRSSQTTYVGYEAALTRMKRAADDWRNVRAATQSLAAAHIRVTMPSSVIAYEYSFVHDRSGLAFVGALDIEGHGVEVRSDGDLVAPYDAANALGALILEPESAGFTRNDENRNYRLGRHAPPGGAV